MKALLLLALVSCSTAWGKTEKVKESKLPNGLVVHEYRMHNGLQLLLVPEHSAPVVTFQAWFKVGSAAEKVDEKLRKTGLAHLFEHMMFRGTPKNPDQVFDTKLSAAGAVDMNATTWLDRTNYFESLPKERLELAFELESDRMTNLVINENLFKTELGAVVGELKMREDKPANVAREKVWELAFEHSPYRWSVIGTLEELRSFTVADAMYFYKTYYAPNNATLIILGDFQIPAVLALAEKYYGKLPSQPIPRQKEVVEPEQTQSKNRTLPHPLATTDIVAIAYKIPAMNDPDMAVLDVAASLLAYGNGSWLEQELVQEGIVSSVSASPSKTLFPSLFQINLQMAPGKSTNQAIAITKAAVERIRNGKISQAELERAKNQYLLLSYQELLEINNIGRNLGESLVSSNNYLRDFEILEQVKKVTVQDLQRVAKKYFAEKQSSQIIVTPAKGK